MKNEQVKETEKTGNAKRKKSAAFWVKAVVILLLSLLLVLNILTVVISKLGLRRSLNFLPGAFMAVESGSMEPELSKGDLVFVYRTSFEKLKVGDMITYYSGEEFITHGITRIESDAVIAQGLQNELEDDTPVTEAEYAAKVIFAIPNGEALWNLLEKPWFTVVLLALIAAVCYGLPLFNFVYDWVASKKRPQMRLGAIRVLCSAVLVSTTLLTPFLTAAKYKAEVGGVVISSAESIYFRSNYLSEDGNDYYIKGWAGLGHDVYLDIRNWANQLLYNDTEDVTYTVKLEKIVNDAEYEEAASYEAGKQYFVKKTVYDLYSGDGSDETTLYTRAFSPLTPANAALVPGTDYYKTTPAYEPYYGNGVGAPTLYKHESLTYEEAVYVQYYVMLPDYVAYTGTSSPRPVLYDSTYTEVEYDPALPTLYMVNPARYLSYTVTGTEDPMPSLFTKSPDKDEYYLFAGSPVTGDTYYVIADKAYAPYTVTGTEAVLPALYTLSGGVYTQSTYRQLYFESATPNYVAYTGDGTETNRPALYTCAYTVYTGALQSDTDYFYAAERYVTYTGNGTESPLPTLYLQTKEAYVGDYTLGIEGQEGGYVPTVYEEGSTAVYYARAFYPYDGNSHSVYYVQNGGNYLPAEYEAPKTYYVADPTAYLHYTGGAENHPALYLYNPATYAEATYEADGSYFVITPASYESYTVTGSEDPMPALFTEADGVYTAVASPEAGQTYYKLKAHVNYMAYTGDGTEPHSQLYLRTAEESYTPYTGEFDAEATYYYAQATTYSLYTGDGTEDPMPTVYTEAQGEYSPATYHAPQTYYYAQYEVYTIPEHEEGDELTLPDLYEQKEDTYGPFVLLHGKTDENKVRSDTLHVVLQSTRTDGTNVIPLTGGEKVRFRITAETDPDSQYYQVLTGVFTLEVATSSDFVGSYEYEQQKGTTLVGFNLKTNRIAETAYRTVVFSWSLNDFDINRLISPVWDFINEDDKCYVVNTATNTVTMTLTLKAPAIYKFQFFKTDASKRMGANVLLNQGDNQDTDYITFITEEYPT